MPRIKNIACVGGVHGDELTGIFLIKKFQRSPSLVRRSSFRTLALLGNPEAIAAGRRYIDRDLNRCFHQQDLANIYLSCYEDKRAKELHKILTSKDDDRVDFILDIHTTTANMGLSLILVNEHPFNLQLATHLFESIAGFLQGRKIHF
jgi:aspartoacylase